MFNGLKQGRVRNPTPGAVRARIGVVPVEVRGDWPAGSRLRLALAFWLALHCDNLTAKTRWVEPTVPSFGSRTPFIDLFSPRGPSAQAQAAFEDGDARAGHAAERFRSANRLHRERNEGCIDDYYRAALTAWKCLESYGPAHVDAADTQVAWVIYHECVAALIQLGQQYGRLDPRRGLLVYTEAGTQLVPLAYRGFAWRAEDFHRLLVVGDYTSNDFSHHYRQPGLGVSLVALRFAPKDQLFLGDTRPFAATAVLRTLRAPSVGTAGPGQGAPNDSRIAVLELHNPLAIRHVTLSNGSLPLHRDHTASLAFMLSENPRAYLAGFFQPGTGLVRPRISMLEPYQPGKIPLVLIHGLFSDPMTWMDLANEILAEGDIYDRYQIWAFRYPTGSGFFEQAAGLREQLQVARQLFDPAHTDASLSEIVLIGHSMGGLVAKLQVTDSGDQLWREVANVPLEAVRTTPQVREQLQTTLFFEPLPFVTRVVFVGTPHQGSGRAMRLMGRLASSLVEFSQERNRDWDELMRNNPGAFNPLLIDRPPTSVDLLEPSNPLLGAMRELPLSPLVRIHSIIGTGGSNVGEGPSDGIVPVASAQHPGVESEVYIDSRHARLQRHQETVAEVKRILRLHAAFVGD